MMEICTDAERVARSRDLKLDGAKLCVRPLRPGRPPTFVTDSNEMYLSNAFLFIDLPQRVDADKLKQYAEKAAKTPVDEIIFSCTNPSAALIKYTADPGIEAVVSFLYQA